jgi:hypothetical protein
VSHHEGLALGFTDYLMIVFELQYACMSVKAVVSNLC